MKPPFDLTFGCKHPTYLMLLDDGARVPGFEIVINFLYKTYQTRKQIS